MEVITQPDIIAPGTTVATIGMFDGVHRGHAMLINFLNETARKHKLKSAVITFKEHPQQVLYPNSGIKMLMTLDERLDAIKQLGADYIVLMDFDIRLSTLSSANYIKFIRDHYGVSVLITGFNHRFGHNRAEDFNDYKQHGAKLGVELIQADEYHGIYSPVSSSIIRKLIMAGKVDDAANCLGRNFKLDGTVEHGFEIGHSIGFPTANVGNINPMLVIPHRGAYAVRVSIEDGRTLGGMANIGTRPTMDNGSKQSIEVHIFDFDDNIYGQRITVEFVKFLRTETKMNSIEELKQQLEEDRIRSKQILGM